MRQQEWLDRDVDTAAGWHSVRDWNALALQAIRTARVPAPPAARTLAILHTALYNAWAAYDDAARQTADGVAVRLPRGERRGAGRTVAMAHAAHLVLANRFPAQRAAFDAHLAQLLRRLPRPSSPALPPARTTGTLRPAGIGRVQAASLLDACGQDGAVPLSIAAGAEPVCERWCLLAREIGGSGAGDDRDALLFFVLANALDGAFIALRTAQEGTLRSLLLERLPAAAGMAWREGCDGAAGEVLRLFADEAAPAAWPSWGQALGARMFERARRLQQGQA